MCSGRQSTPFGVRGRIGRGWVSHTLDKWKEACVFVPFILGTGLSMKWLYQPGSHRKVTYEFVFISHTFPPAIFAFEF